MTNKLILIVLFICLTSLSPFGQTKAPTPKPSPTPKPISTAPAPAPKTTAPAPKSAAPAPTDAEAVLTAFNHLLDGIRHADVKAVTSVYWNSPRLSLFNYNGSVTKGWEQMKANRESSYPEIRNTKLDVRDVSVTMLGRDGALVTCVWTQSQDYKGTPETASGRMTLVFRKIGTAWKAIHLHSSPDQPNPASIPPSEQVSPSEVRPSPTPTPTPTP